MNHEDNKHMGGGYDKFYERIWGTSTGSHQTIEFNLFIFEIFGKYLMTEENTSLISSS